MRNYWSRGVRNKKGTSDYLEQPVPLFGEEFGEQDSCMMTDPLMEVPIISYFWSELAVFSGS